MHVKLEKQRNICVLTESAKLAEQSRRRERKRERERFVRAGKERPRAHAALPASLRDSRFEQTLQIGR